MEVIKNESGETPKVESKLIVIVGVEEISKQFLKDIARELLDRYTYTEDAYHAFLKHCFTGAGLERVESFILRDNRPAIAINRKVGFEIEGIGRKARLRHLVQSIQKPEVLFWYLTRAVIWFVIYLVKNRISPFGHI
jgi:hypothetical protein